MDGAAVIKDGQGGTKSSRVQCEAEEIWDSRLWSKTGPKQTHGPLRAFVVRASAPGNREVVEFRASKGSLGVKIMPLL